MKKILYILVILVFGHSYGQQEDQRINNIKTQLELLSVESAGLTENVKTEINISNISLANFLMAISEVHKVNINVAPELSQITITNNFTNVTVADLLVFLCKEHRLTIDFTGNILSIKTYLSPQIIEKHLSVKYIPTSNIISIDAKQDKLYDVFKTIMDESGKNLVFTPGMETQPLTAYIQNVPFDSAMDKLALANNLYLDKSKDNFYVFDRPQTTAATETKNPTPRIQRPRNSSFEFKVLDKTTKLLEVNFSDTPIEFVISDISEALELDVFTATPLNAAGKASLQAKSIHFDDLLIKLFESQSIVDSQPVNNATNNRNQTAVKQQPSAAFSFKKEGNIYFFGMESQLSIRKVEAIYLQYRTAELLSDPENGGYRNSTTNSVFNNLNATNDNYGGNQNNGGTNRGREQLSGNNKQFDNFSNKGEALISLLPDELKKDLDIKIDFELNAFYVNGPSAKVDRFKAFVKEIDKPVPVILIEVMILEVSKSATIETGVSWGIADSPSTTQGTAFPTTDMTLGANTVNKVIGSFNNFSGFNLGKVGANFFATIKAMETNGDLKIRSTPRLTTLNSHRATFSNGQTSFYAVTRRNIYGTDNPQTSEITNYLPIEAELGLTVKPSVSKNGQVLLDISVIQSSFGGRVADDAPPDVNSRSFSSLIRMKDQDIAILGGLEEQVKNNSGTGVPFLARVPIIKWLFSKRKREARKTKLTVLIKPTVLFY